MSIFRDVLSGCVIVFALSAYAAMPMDQNLQGGVPCDAIASEHQCVGGSGCPNRSLARVQGGAANVIIDNQNSDNRINYKNSSGKRCDAYMLPDFSGGCEIVIF